MVQISSAIVAAAFAAPVLAAPFGGHAGHFNRPRDEEVEAREPKFHISSAQLKTAGTIAKAAGHAAKSGVEFGATVGSVIPHSREYEDLETRKFHISSKTAGRIAKGLAGAAGFAGTTAIAATQAQPAQAREYEDLETRKFHISSKTAGRIAKGLAGAAGFAGTTAIAATQNQAPAQARELEDIEERKFHISSKTAGRIAKGLAGAAGFAGTTALAATQPQAREFEYVDEVDARDPSIFGKIFKGAAKVAGSFLREDEEEEMLAREFDDAEIDAREPRFGGHGRPGGFRGHAAPAEREFDDEVDARDPSIFGKIFKGAAKVAGSFLREDEEEEILAREFDDAEIDAREPRFHGHGRPGGFRGHGPPAAAPSEREFDDDMEVDARDPKFSFGKILKGAAKVAGSFLREDEEDELLAREYASEYDELD